MCAKERRKEAMMIQEKSSNGYYSIAAFFYILLNNLEADTQRMRMLIPIGTKQYELANLSC